MTKQAFLSSPSPDRPGRARAFYDTLLQATTHKSKRASLERVWRALESLRKMDVKEFGPANVAREISRSEHGTPSYQTIRNAAGLHFRQLIAAYEEEYGVPYVRSTDDSNAEVIRALSEQPRLQLRYARMVEFNQALQLQVKLLQEQLGKLASSMAPGRQSQTDGGVTVAFDSFDVYAVRKFLENIGSRDWEIGARGKLLDERKHELAPIGFVPALRKISPTDE